ncbi:MAG: hypothetical protein Q8M31_00260 [Beijerinckiaceae bacterium]|nr:hypothetical protein [Beijerinckiaceae bacterium]
MPSEAADVVLTLHYVDDGSVARIFEIAADLIRAFEEFDDVVIASVDSSIRTSLILDDVEKSSLKVFLRNLLRAVDDQAIKELDWKPAVGKYLVEAKYAAIRWLDSDPTHQKLNVRDLTAELRDLAAKTEARHLPDYPPVNAARLAQPLDKIQRAKAKFKEGERLTITLDATEFQVDLRQTWSPLDYVPDDTEQQLSNTVDMVLIIRKPDFLGKSQWQFRHGRSDIYARITDETWLSEFQSGIHTIKPGDGLRTTVKFDYRYAKDGTLTEQKTEIVRVYSIIPASPPARELFEDDE